MAEVQFKLFWLDSEQSLLNDVRKYMNANAFLTVNHFCNAKTWMFSANQYNSMHFAWHIRLKNYMLGHNWTQHEVSAIIIGFVSLRSSYKRIIDTLTHSFAP